MERIQLNLVKQQAAKQTDLKRKVRVSVWVIYDRATLIRAASILVTRVTKRAFFQQAAVFTGNINTQMTWKHSLVSQRYLLDSFEIK